MRRTVVQEVDNWISKWIESVPVQARDELREIIGTAPPKRTVAELSKILNELNGGQG